MIADILPFTDWFIALLIKGTHKPIGDAEVPEVPNGDPQETYGIVYPVSGGQFTGSLANPDEDVQLIFQVTSVGRQRRQAQWMSDLVRRTVLNRAIGGFQVQLDPPAGWAVADRRPIAAPGLDLGGQPPHRVYSVAERFAIYVTPA